MDVTVRVMSPDEYPAARAVSVAAFGDEPIGELLDALRDSPAWRDELSFLAEHDGEIVGQVLYTVALLDAPRELVEVLVLSPVGVRPDVQNQGIGNRLVTESLAAVADRPEPLVFLEGIPTYYPRFGFRPAVELGFRKPSLRTPDAAFMVYPLPAYDSAWMTGTLVYPDPFSRTDSVGLRSEDRSDGEDAR